MNESPNCLGDDFILLGGNRKISTRKDTTCWLKVSNFLHKQKAGTGDSFPSAKGMRKKAGAGDTDSSLVAEAKASESASPVPVLHLRK